jgi:hypothetical protein
MDSVMGQMKPSTTEATNASPSNIIFQMAIVPKLLLLISEKMGAKGVIF